MNQKNTIYDKRFEYKGYQGSVEFNYNTMAYQGRILFIPDKIMYDGKTTKEFEQAFQDAVNDYINKLIFDKNKGV